MLPFLPNRRWLYPWLLSALAETAVAIPWVIFIYSIMGEKRWPEALPGAWLLLLAYLAAGLWEAGTPGAGQEGTGKRRLVAMGVGLTAVYGAAYSMLPHGLRPGSVLRWNLALSVLPAAGYLWYQGARSAAEGIEYSRIYERFTRQCVAMAATVVALVWAGTAADSRVQVLLFWSVPLLFASGLTLLVVTRERELRSNQARLGEEGTDSGAGSRIVTWVVAGLLGLTLTASSVLSADRLQRIAGSLLRGLDRPFTWLADVVMLLLYRWVMLIGLVLEPIIRWLIAHRRPSEPPQQVQDGAPNPLDELKNLTGPSASFEWLIPWIKVLLLAATLIALGVWAYRLSHRVQRPVAEEEERISLGFWAGLLADLRAMLGLLRRGPARGAGAVAAPVAEVLDPRNPRALYRRLQAWGAAAGRPRRPGETPSAYREALVGKRPGLSGAIAAVTGVYNQARYGAHPPAGEAVGVAAEAVSELESGEGGQ